MTPRTPTVEDRVPTVEQTPGLLAVWELRPGETEIRHAGAWHLLGDVQPAADHPDHGTRRVYLRLHPTETEISSIDPTTGIVDRRPATLADGPVILTELDVLRRARHRSVLEV